MRSLLLFIDGAAHAAIWTTGPLLLPSLVDLDPGRRALSAEQALSATGTLPRTDGNATTAARGMAPMLEREGVEILSSTTGSMELVLLAFLVGRALGCYIMDTRTRHRRYARLNLLIRRLHGVAPVINAPSWRIACAVVAATASLFLLNWGLGVCTFGGWLMVRFVTALLSGGIATWGRDVIGGDHFVRKEKGDLGDQRIMMEEGRPHLSETFKGDEGDEMLSQQLLDRKWLDWYWLSGVASSALLSGYVFYPLNRLTMHPHGRLFAFLLVFGLGGMADQYLFRYYSKNRPSALASLDGPSFSNAGIVGGRGSSFQKPSDGRSIDIGQGSSTSMLQRRKKQLEPTQRRSTFDKDQQITSSNHQIELHRHRSNSDDTLESEHFFDCLDDISSIDSEHNIAGTVGQMLTSSSDNQIAIYSRRKVSYPDGSPAFVPAGECLSTIPPGYLALHENDRSKALSRYQLTQQWRRKERIYSIHAKYHMWFSKIKTAYPHVIHGFTHDGMPVMYESPGRMNLKHLFCKGCHVEDMIFHYCYSMEYLSNLETILTELHSDDTESHGDDKEWQDVLAAYANAKQRRLQSDPVSFRFCVVMDVSGATPTSLSGDVMSYLKRAGDINSLHYPGSMHLSVVVQAPFWIGAVWKAIKSVLPSSVTVDILSGVQTVEGGLRKYINEDQIPVEYGGKSKFKLGEHPFEVGLKKLAERQEEEADVIGSGCKQNSLEVPQTEADSPLYDPVPPNFSPTPLERVKRRQDSPASFTDHSTMAREWEDLGATYILTVTAILYFFVFVIIGSLELAMPYWIISPSLVGGAGYEAHSSGMTVFVSYLFLVLAIKRSRFPQLPQSVVTKSPLRGFRIGIGTMCFVLACVSLIPITSSTLWLLCFSAQFSLGFFGGSLGILSLEYLYVITMTSSEEVGSDTPHKAQSTTAMSTFGRVAGYICVGPIFRRSTRKGLSFPLNASFFLFLLACISWLLYIVSFSLYTAAPSPRSHHKKKESQFMSAMMGWFLFVKEVLLVAYADVCFLASEL